MTQADGSLDGALVEEFRRRLREARERVLRTVTGTGKELDTLEEHHPGAPAEDVNRELMADLISRLETRERRALDEIQAAEDRLDTGVFGRCEECGEPIPLARLRALPAARYCVACQSRQETAR